MTESEKEQRRYALAVSGGVCEVCGAPLGANAQGAHRIGNTIVNRKKYGDFVIDHRFNIGYVCCLECNGELDISKNPGKVIELCKQIYDTEVLKYRG